MANPIGGNRLYLTCSCGLDPIELARRRTNTYQESKEVKYHFDQWLTHHAQCGDGPDHFKLAYQSMMNWDQPQPADPVSNAVRLELVKGALHD
jgi:hypothetical protein